MDPRLVRDRERPHGWIVRVDGTDQSYVDSDDPTYLGFDYVERIVDVINSVFEERQRITAVHVGGAGMTIPRYIAHTRPTSGQIVLEPDAGLTTAVREAIPLPRNSGIKVRAIDGRSGISQLRDGYADLVIVDAFTGPGVPAELGTRSWFQELHRVLGDQGTRIMNLTDMAPCTYSRRIIAGIMSSFTPVIVGAEPSTWKGRRYGNLVVSAGQRLDPDLLVRQAAGGFFPYRLLDGIELERWVGHAEAFSDHDAESSPAPEHLPMFR
jgi:spermidine synthase